MHIRTAESLQGVCPCGRWRPGQGCKPVGIEPFTALPAGQNAQVGWRYGRQWVARIGLDAMNYEKMQSSRRSARPSTRKRNLLVGARIVRRENGILSSERALSDEKMQSSRRSTRPSTRKWNRLVRARVLQRENGIMSSEDALSDEKTESCRRSAHCPTRRRKLVVGGRIIRRENGISSPEHAFAVEKKLSSAQGDSL